MSRFPAQKRPARWSQTSLVLTPAEDRPCASSPAEPPAASTPPVEEPPEAPPALERAPYMSIAFDVERRRTRAAKNNA